jgi:hypothetical protein
MWTRSSWDIATPLDDAQKAALLGSSGRRRGFVAAHVGLTAFEPA